MSERAPYVHHLSFGDCDPAGIVFYPNVFRWMDAAFHHHLRPFGGHKVICGQLGAIGLGLIDASAQFIQPLTDGDSLTLVPTIARWGRKSLTVEYEGRSGDRLAITGREVRGIFRRTAEGITTGEVAELRALMEPEG